MKNDVEYEFESCVPFIAERFYLSSSTSEEGGRETSRRPARHEIVCRHWLRGICIKESRCDFLHVFDDSRMPYCRNQKRHGRCVDQVLGFCALKHDQQEVRGAGSNRTRERSPAMTQSTNGGDVCMRYLFGYCSHGPACHQQHIRLERRDLPLAPLPDWYLSLIISSYDGHQSGNAVHQSAPSGAGGAGASGLLLGVPALSEEERQQSTQTWTGFVERLTGRSTAYHPLEELLPTTSLCPNGDSNRGVGGPKIRCFVIKSGKIENILTSVQRGIWATGKNNQEKLRQAWLTCDHVVLLMSANESGGFQGYARMASGFDETLYPRIWGSFSNKLSPNFRVQWLKQAKLDFEALSAFTNPWNENRPLKKSRDGQEMPLEIAEAICSRLYNAPSEDLLLGTPLQDLPRIDHLTFFNLSPKEQLVLETKIGLRQPPSAPQTVTPQNLVYSFNKNDLGIIPRPIQPPQPVNLPNGMSSGGMPPGGMPPSGMPPSGMPPSGMPPSGMPPNSHPARGPPPGSNQRYSPVTAGMSGRGRPPHHTGSRGLTPGSRGPTVQSNPYADLMAVGAPPGGGFQPSGFQQPGFQPPGFQPPGFQQSGFQPPGFQPPGYQPPGYQPPGYQPPGSPRQRGVPFTRGGNSSRRKRTRREQDNRL